MKGCIFRWPRSWPRWTGSRRPVRYLRRALEDGFGNFKKIENDPDLQRMAEYPPYVELLRNPPTAIPSVSPSRSSAAGGPGRRGGRASLFP